ncbi:hypothetical protein TTHERM_000353259 (macronuclear) [Tetrahymena thermophila SB210]|uniref:Uncharacterized protein n=1 Tax=Tetrahymena thermophila (strain SB210) TaxID=312017 RepID=W7X7S6_TETTS|nr:hypothetical protein TTHERM_000353259 [Tetrahymena thermophila SB210]EWS72478.1 hypothetical protein TTHERM_000353259 [Tetrahymena thermophila SB210]|eukprot:XP_012654975.1 hypothetical protein TTHERM_000353259 [Tetrahymena thermophila SB210]
MSYLIQNILMSKFQIQLFLSHQLAILIELYQMCSKILNNQQFPKINIKYNQKVLMKILKTINLFMILLKMRNFQIKSKNQASTKNRINTLKNYNYQNQVTFNMLIYQKIFLQMKFILSKLSIRILQMVQQNT